MGCKYLITLFTIIAVTCHVYPQSASEYELKAAFLYNFAKFVEWPSYSFPDTSDPFIIGILGEDPFGPHLQSLINGKTINGRRLIIKRMSRTQDLGSCHILFISSSEKSQMTQILGLIRDRSVLTIGEAEGFTHMGGIINFTVEQNKVRFEVDATAAERTGLKISSKLLRLAKAVR